MLLGPAGGGVGEDCWTVALLAESGTVDVAGWSAGWARAGIAGRAAAAAETRRIERFIWAPCLEEVGPC
jgi:hypothetical protein